MKIIHSFYANDNASIYGLFLHVSCYALSCLYAKRAGIEQQFLKDYCEYKGYNVKLLLDTDDIQGSAKKLKYSHLIGDYKRVHIDRIINCIYKYDIKLYNKLKEIFYILFPKYFEK